MNLTGHEIIKCNPKTIDSHTFRDFNGLAFVKGSASKWKQPILVYVLNFLQKVITQYSTFLSNFAASQRNKQA